MTHIHFIIKLTYVIILIIISVYLFYLEYRTFKYEEHPPTLKQAGFMDSKLAKGLIKVGQLAATIASIYGGAVTFRNEIEKNHELNRLNTEMVQAHQMMRNHEELSKAVKEKAQQGSSEVNNILSEVQQKISTFETENKKLSDL